MQGVFASKEWHRELSWAIPQNPALFNMATHSYASKRLFLLFFYLCWGTHKMPRDRKNFSCFSTTTFTAPLWFNFSQWMTYWRLKFWPNARHGVQWKRFSVKLDKKRISTGVSGATASINPTEPCNLLVMHLFIPVKVKKFNKLARWIRTILLFYWFYIDNIRISGYDNAVSIKWSSIKRVK